MQNRILRKELKLLSERIECVKECISIDEHVNELACAEIWSDSYLQELWDALVEELEEKYPTTFSSERFTKALLSLRAHNRGVKNDGGKCEAA